MDFRVKFLFYFVVLGAVETFPFHAFDDYPITTSCFIQYLHEKGKLDEPLPSTVQSTSRCRLVTAFFLNNYVDRADRRYTPAVAECVKNEMVNREIYDYVIKNEILTFSRLFNNAAGRTQSEKTSHHLIVADGEIAVKCKLDGIGVKKNLTVEDHQREYCLRQYALDSQLLELNDLHGGVKPHDIDTESVNCTNIVAAERSKTETQFKEKISASDCVMNEFRNGNLFGWKTATLMKWPYRISGLSAINEKMEEFLGKPAFECVD